MCVCQGSTRPHRAPCKRGVPAPLPCRCAAAGPPAYTTRPLPPLPLPCARGSAENRSAPRSACPPFRAGRRMTSHPRHPCWQMREQPAAPPPPLRRPRPAPGTRACTPSSGHRCTCAGCAPAGRVGGRDGVPLSADMERRGSNARARQQPTVHPSHSRGDRSPCCAAEGSEMAPRRCEIGCEGHRRAERGVRHLQADCTRPDAHPSLPPLAKR